MRLQLTEQWPTVVETMTIADETGRALWTVRAKTLALRDKLTIRAADGTEVGCLEAGWLGGYTVSLDGRPVARVGGGTRPRVELLDGRGRLKLVGEVGRREFQVTDRTTVYGTVSRSFFAFTDRYGLDVPDPADALWLVGLVVALHRLGTGR